jgi:hypothetical protein
MALFSDEELIKRLHLVLWDSPVPAERLLPLLKAEKDEVEGFTRKNLYRKVVNGFNWHIIRHMIPENRLHEALSDEVINGLFPRSLRDKYRYVRSLL